MRGKRRIRLISSRNLQTLLSSAVVSSDQKNYNDYVFIEKEGNELYNFYLFIPRSAEKEKLIVAAVEGPGSKLDSSFYLS